MQEDFKLTIIILSAGDGDRMKSSTSKVLHKVAGQTLIEYSLELSKEFDPGLKNTITVINDKLRQDEVFKEILRQNNHKSVVQKRKLGTGDAVDTALRSSDEIKDIVLILYADTPFVTSNTIRKMYDEILQGADLSIVGFVNENPIGYGRLVVDDNCRVSEIIEEKETDEKQRLIKLCNSGIMMVKKDLLLSFFEKYKDIVLDGDKEFYLTDIVSYANFLQKKCVYVDVSKEEAMGINTKKQLMFAENYMQEKITCDLLDNGVLLIKPETSYFSKNIMIERDVTIYPNVFIGNGTKLHTGVTIKSFSHIEQAEIKKDSVIGPYARIRPNTIIGEDSKIGNFVEIKNSSIMNGVKMGHLSYVGDATIGENVNIGAGTIFCNYDGKKKHKSVVEENVFIGSNTSIISPVIIKKNSKIGAGSVITKDIGEEELAIGRSKQINIKKK
ncbi:MAG: bifunctional UDP-N-acetylglucosamine pyrophosphorylase/glucosamine-1-phosphate N-acetyltransferase [Candidatus Midichloriaceae bacterium]|jgi:bifunctional UDP-N-acetylglucosamine pyrophosphorylase/glucosamine-1-phosphate N-acetyltransferase